MPLPTWMSLAEDPGLGDEGHPAADQASWLVDNSGLQSKAKGICYRNSPNVWDKSAAGVALFDTVVHGKLVCSAEGDWVEVDKSKYLPLKVQDHVVLVSTTSTQPSEEMSLSIYELAAKREAEAALEAEGLKKQVQELEPKEWGPVQATPLAEKPDAVPTVAGPGEWFTVVKAHVNVRATPEGHVANNKFKGDLVQLYEWDESGRWRHCLEGLGGEPGWMMVEHPEFGVLLRPLDPLGDAARTGDLVVLRQQLRRTKYRDLQGASGQTALRIAAEKAHHDCIVALIESGLDAKSFLRMATRQGGQGTPNFKEKGPTLALMSALCDLRSYDEGDFKVAMGALSGEMAETAEMIIDRLAYKNSLNHDDDADSAPGEAEEHGEDYLVVHQRLVAVRGKPDTNSDIVASLQPNDVVKLLEPDESGQWRRYYVKEVKIYGWVLLGHEKFGALLKPLTPEEAAEARRQVRKTDWTAVFHGSPGKGSPGGKM